VYSSFAGVFHYDAGAIEKQDPGFNRELDWEKHIPP
jgi:hypothetical protein